MEQSLAIGDLELAGRVVLSMTLCGAIGLEREVRGQIAGLRTHIIVGLGATLFTLVSAYGFLEFYPPEDAGIPRPDPARVAAQIVPGIGFLGAGAVIKYGVTVRGLTTAGALWICAAIGMSVGVGYYLGALIATAIVLFALLGLRLMWPLLNRLREDLVYIDVDLRPGESLVEALELLDELGIHIDDLEERAEGRRRITIHVPEDSPPEAIAERLRTLESVRDAEIRGRGLAIP